MRFDIRKNISACLFSVHNKISLSCHEQVSLMRLRFERYFSRHRAKMVEVSWWWEKYLAKCSLIKHTCSWRDKLIVLLQLTVSKTGIVKSKPPISFLKITIKLPMPLLLALNIMLPDVFVYYGWQYVCWGSLFNTPLKLE